MIRNLILGLSLVASSVFAQINTLDPTQVYTTANITNNTTSPTNTTGTWQNIGLWDQGLPCWAPGGPVYCGPQPYFNNGSFNFSYGLTDVYQVVNIANALPNSGTGLRVNGYNFTFMAKNGNGWDNGQTDYLSAYVNFFGKDGKSVRYDYYDLNYKFDWTQFGYSKTFDTPFASKDLSTVQYGFVGGDSNFWAGPYGPEVQNIGFSLKYSVDPCFVNVLSSPTCPGYLDALAKLMPVSTTTTDPISSTATSPGVTTTTTVTADPTNPTVTVTSTPTQATTQAISTTTPVATTTSSSSSSSGTSIGLSVIARNREREQTLITQTVQNALTTAAEAASSSEKEALAVASQSSQNSQTSTITQRNTEHKESNNQNNVITVSTQNTSNSVLNLLVGPQTQTNNFSNQQNQSIVSTNIVNVTRPPQVTQTQEVNNVVSSSTFSLLPENRQTTTTFQNVQNIEENKTSYSLYKPNIISATNEVQSFVTQNFLTDRTNPLNEVTENKIVMSETNVARTGPAVNKNVANNELAGTVDINRMALAPTGYNDYLNFTLKDGRFYEPKEIYKNQRNVDNVRALRQLSSDRLHQEMVEQQYRR